MEGKDESHHKKLKAIIDKMHEEYGETFRRLAEHPVERSGTSEDNDVNFEETRAETPDDLQATMEKINKRYSRSFKRLSE